MCHKNDVIYPENLIKRRYFIQKIKIYRSEEHTS